MLIEQRKRSDLTKAQLDKQLRRYQSVNRLPGRMTSLTVLGGDMTSRRHRDNICPRTAYLPQDLGRNLYPTLSVVEDIDFFGRL